MNDKENYSTRDRKRWWSIAAFRCYLTQSAVSQHINTLEENWSTNLLSAVLITECWESLFTICSNKSDSQTLQWIATYHVVSDIQPSEGYGAQIRLCSLDGWIFVLYWEWIDLYQEKTKNFENIRFSL